MTARRIFLSPAESRGLLDGRVSLLLRPVRPQPNEDCASPWMPIGGFYKERWRCPFGIPGDTLWGAEAWYERFDGLDDTYFEAYAADGELPCSGNLPSTAREAMYAGSRRKVSSALMHRRDSRHVLTLASVRVVRVLKISEEDARATGFGTTTPPFWDAWTARYGARYPWESAWAWALGVDNNRGPQAATED